MSEAVQQPKALRFMPEQSVIRLFAPDSLQLFLYNPDFALDKIQRTAFFPTDIYVDIHR